MIRIKTRPSPLEIRERLQVESPPRTDLTTRPHPRFPRFTVALSLFLEQGNQHRPLILKTGTFREPQTSRVTFFFWTKVSVGACHFWTTSTSPSCSHVLSYLRHQGASGDHKPLFTRSRVSPANKACAFSSQI